MSLLQTPSALAAILARAEGPSAAYEPGTFPRHCIEPPELTLSRTYAPMGFPVEVHTNDAEVFPLLSRMWDHFEPSGAAPLRMDVHVLDGDGSTSCPPAAVYRLIQPLLVAMADGNNYSIVNLATSFTQVCIARSTLAYPMYAEWFLLGAPNACICTRLATPIHGACVSRNGHGVLLCGESGAGKSTLAYACARAGWTYTCDDATLIPNHETGRRVVGNCHQVRFRPSAAELFPEIMGRDVTPRAAGKPSIEIPTAELPQLQPAFHADIAHIVFLDRRDDARPSVEPYCVSAAREYFRSVLYGVPRMLAVQYEVLERMLTAPVHRLVYQHLDDAIVLLEQLVDWDRG